MKQVPDGYKMVPFDVKSLFTNVPLEKTIEITLKRIYERKEINTSISKKEMKQLLTLCTKNVHFTYDNKVYQQNDGVAMGSPLGPVLSGIFMVKLENSLVPTLNESMTLCQRFVDDNITFVKNDSIAYVLDQLNSFHEQIQFTYEVEHNNKLPFLDVLLIKNANKIDTTVYRKPTNTDVYLNWNTHAPTTWKRGTLRTILSRAYTICSSETYLNEEIKYIESTFEKVNNYPKYVITQLKREVKL